MAEEMIEVLGDDAPHMRGIPRKVRICGIDYDVIFKQELDLEVDGQSMSPVHGVISYNDGKILLQRQRNLDWTKATLLHEVIHGVDRAFGLSLKEYQIRCLGIGLHEFLRDTKMDWES